MSRLCFFLSHALFLLSFFFAFQAKACGLSDEEGKAPLLVEEVSLDQQSETKRVKLSTAMDVLAFRTDREQWRSRSQGSGGASPSGGCHEAEEVSKEVRLLMARMNAPSLPLRRTLGDFLRFNVTPQDHFNYAATWFTLALCTAAMAYARIRSAQAGRQWWYFGSKRKKLGA